MASNGAYVGDESHGSDPRTPELEEGTPDWILLLQIDSDPAPGMMWGDEGRIYYWIRKQDLAGKDFGTVWFALQCY